MRETISIIIDALLVITLILLEMRVFKLENRMKSLVQLTDVSLSVIADRVRDLETGVVPDFEKAKEAAKAVNDFSSGIVNILGFDPVMAVRKQNEKE